MTGGKIRDSLPLFESSAPRSKRLQDILSSWFVAQSLPDVKLRAEPNNV